MSQHEYRELLASVPTLALPAPAEQRTTYPDAATLVAAADDAFAQLKTASFAEQPELLNTLYRAWSASKLPGFEAAAATLGTADDLQRTRPAVLRQLIRMGFDYFDKQIFQPPGMVELPTPGRSSLRQSFGMYTEGPAVWFPIKTADDRSAVFAQREVVEEARQLEEEQARPEADMFHTTSSAALGGVLHAGSILSVAKMREEGLAVASGEYLTLDVHEDDRLRYVYTSNDIGAEFGGARWFSEHQITFGAMARSVEDVVAARTGARPNYHAAVANGHEIPDELPLEHVTAVYTYRRFKPLVQAALQQAGMSVPTISAEAATLLRLHLASGADIYGNYIYRHHAPLEQSAAEILRKDPIVTC